MLKGRHRVEPAPVRAFRQILAALVEHWPLAVAAVITVLIAAAALTTAANAEPPPTTLGAKSAEIGFVAGNPGATP
jgi:hypothetical protein